MAALEPGSRFPILTLRDAGGAPLATPPGETLYVVFKTTCPTCELSWPFLDRIRTKADGAGLRVLAISQDDPRTTDAFARRLGTGIPTAFDPPPWPASDALGVSAVPTFLRVGAGGRVEETVTGFDRARMESFAARADSLAGRSPTPLFHSGETVPAVRPG